MHIYDHILAQFISLRNVLDKIIKKMKTHLLFPVTAPPPQIVSYMR